MKSNRRRRLILWSLGMGMVAAFIQSRLAAARMAMAETPPQEDHGLSRQVEAAIVPAPTLPLWLRACEWEDNPEVSRSFSRWGVSVDRKRNET